MIEIKTLGDFRILRDGAEVSLPPSRKARALLAYLAVTGRQHRRARLSELLWSDSEDPKGSLRWALSRLRQVVGQKDDADGSGRLVTDRESVTLDLGEGAVDILNAKKILRHADDHSDEDLIQTEMDFKGPLFAGLEMPDQAGFEAWRVSEAADAERLYSDLLKTLVSRLDASPQRALPYARKRAKLDHHDQEAQADLLQNLLRCARREEAIAHLSVARSLLAEVSEDAALWLDKKWKDFCAEETEGVDRSAEPTRQMAVSGQEPTRRVTAILAADVVGFSKLMGADETGTISALRDLRDKIWDPQVASHGGKILSTAGDGVVAGFDEGESAVAAGMAMQSALSAEVSPNMPTRITQRTGVHMGNVLYVDDDALGAPLTIAEELQKRSTAGGMAISEEVFSTLSDDLRRHFEKTGTLEFSDFDMATTSYAWSPLDQSAQAKTNTVQSITEVKRPCVAVLRFANLSGDETQDYIGEGMADDLITELTKFRWFDVVARDSSFAYQDRAANTQLIARELDVDYVLEGSVRLARPRVRVSAQLIDGKSGRLVWTEHFDGSVESIFDFKDEITDQIVGAIEPELSHVERERAASKSPGSLEIWDIYQKAVWHLTRFNPDDMSEADRLLRDVIERDPKFHRAHAYMAVLRYLTVLVGDPAEATTLLEEADRYGRQAVSLDFYDPLCHYALGLVLMAKRQLTDASFEFQTALDLNPRFVYANYGMGLALRGLNKPAEAAEHFRRVIRLSPRDPILWSAHWALAFSYLLAGEYDAAEEECAKARQYPQTGYWPDITQIAILTAKGQTGKAQTELAKCLESWPGITRDVLRSQARILSADGPSFESFLDLLVEAGLPCDD